MAKQKDSIVKNLNIYNKKASFDFRFIDKYVAGIKLVGTEIKSLRLGKVNFLDSFCFFHNEELFIKNLNISEYSYGNWQNHIPKADRKLLLKKRELKKIFNALDDGMTIVPTRLFINDAGLAKVEIALAQGKKLFDKREDIKKRDTERELGRKF